MILSTMTLLIDGHNMLFRYFNGMPRTIIAKDGGPLHGAYGFIAATLNHLAKFQPNRVIVCFDSMGISKKGSLDADYKRNRTWQYGESPDSNPFSQLTYIDAALKELHISSISIDGIEADDIIAACAQKSSAKGEHVTIISNDRDLLQLCSNLVCVFDRRGGKETMMYADDVFKKYGIEPAQLPDWIALTGDRSDNIQGVRGIGAATATLLLQEYIDIDGIYLNIDKLKPSLAERLAGQKERLIKNLELVRLDGDVPLGEDWWKNTSWQRHGSNTVRSLFTSLNFM